MSVSATSKGGEGREEVQKLRNLGNLEPVQKKLENFPYKEGTITIVGIERHRLIP